MAKRAAPHAGGVRRTRKLTGRDPVTREEFDRLVEAFNARTDQLNAIRDELSVQFRRIAQMQAELDAVKQAWAKMSSPKR